MIRTLVLSALLAPAPSLAADTEDYILLIDRYAKACQALSATECKIGHPVSAEDADRLACMFDQLERRAGPGTAGEHVDWAEGLAASGKPPATGFPTTIGQQQILVAATLACGENR